MVKNVGTGIFPGKSCVSPAVPAKSHLPAVTVPPARRRWFRWGLAAGGLLGVLVWALLTFGLDPWLRRAAQERVQTASKGRYQLRIGNLQTSLWHRRVQLRAVRVHTVATNPDSVGLPRVEAALSCLELTGVGLWALLRRGEVPVDSVLLDSVAVQLHGWPAATASAQPLHQRLPVAGLRVGHLVVQHLHGFYGPAAQPVLQVAEATIRLRDLRLSAAGAADTSRIGYAAAVAGQARAIVARVPGHQLQLGQLAVASQTGRLVLNSVLIQPRQPISARRSATMRVSLALPRLELTGINGAALTRQHFRGDTLRLTAPQLALTLPAQQPPTLHALLAPYLQECRLNAVVVTDGQLRVAGTALAPAVAGVHLTGTAIRVLPYGNGPAGLYYAQAWQGQTGRATATLDAPYYHLSWQRLRADTRAGTLRLANVLVVPTLSVGELSRQKGHQAAHVTVHLPEVQFTGLDFPAAINQTQLRVAMLALRGARVTTRSDGRFLSNPAISHVTPEALGQVPFRFALDRLLISQTTITMLYRAPRQARLGTLQITRFGGTLRNVSNDPGRMRAARPLTGEASGRLQDQCVARLTLRANLLDPTGRHTITGVFGPTPLAILNTMTVPTRGLAFRSGQVEQIRFQMMLDQTAARGTMWGRYTNLKLQLLNRQNRPGVLPRIGTTLVNGLFIRDNNPRQPDQELQPGKIISARERRFSVFSLWRQGLVSGLLNSAGVPSKLAKKLSEGE